MTANALEISKRIAAAFDLIRRELGIEDTLCQLCHEREATQRIEYTFTRDIVPVCDICAERGEEAEDWDR